MAVQSVNPTTTRTKRGLVKVASVSFTAASSVSLDGCFTSEFTHYIVRRNLLGSTALSSLNIRLRASGADDAGTNYRYQYLDASSTTIGAGRVTGQTSFSAAMGYAEATAFGFSETWISNPYEAVRTTAWVDDGYNYTSNILLETVVYSHDLAQSYTGMTVLVSAGTMTGTITVYGLVRS